MTYVKEKLINLFPIILLYVVIIGGILFLNYRCERINNYQTSTQNIF